MTSDKDSSSLFEPLRRYVPLAAWTIVVLVVLMIPLKIISYDYLPGDDALRHAAKAVSGKSWSEILELSPVYKIDHEFGWNWLLTTLHGWQNWEADKLVIFSVVFLFVLINLAGVLWLRRPEAWLAVLLGAMVLTAIPMRFTLGRPYLITAAALITVLYLWRTQRGAAPRPMALLVLVAATAFSTFFHGAWYLWVLPVAAFLLAGEFAWGIALGVCWVIGVFIGSLLTGHPIEYPLQALQLAQLAVGAHETQRTMASELQPFNGDALTVAVFGGWLVLRMLVKLNSVPLARDPAFWLMCLCWILGFKVSRFWVDWGWPTLMVFMAWDLQLFMETRVEFDSLKRVMLVCVLAAATYLGITCDFGSRWTSSLTQQYLEAGNPDLEGWMPDKGGTFYTVDMSLFYQTFFKNPHGDWRYMLGFEPTWMPKEDFDIYQKILWNFNDSKAYDPWVEQMTPADRLAIRGQGGGAPDIPKLEWKYGVSGIWIGRLPRTNEVESATNSISTTPSGK
jgi:hypothetical protein